MHGMCFNEGMSGNCGYSCRAFTSSDCAIVNEIVFDYPITYADFLDCVDIYPYLPGTEMKRITDLMIERMEANAKEVRALTAINSVNWGNLKVDEVVYVADDFNNFVSGQASPYHFCKLSDNDDKFVVFSCGKSSATSTGQSDYRFALPKVAYQELMSSKL